MAGDMSNITNIYLYDVTAAEWVGSDQAHTSAASRKSQEAFGVIDPPVVIMADVYWGKREGAFSHPTELEVGYKNSAYHGFDWSYFRTEVHQRLVWCPEHRCFEKVHHLERMDSIRSVAGCRMRGKVAYFSANIDLSYNENTTKTVTLPIGWEVKRMVDGSVDIQAELFQVPMIINFTDFSISLDVENIESCRVTISENFRVGEGTVNFTPNGKDWTDFGLDIPGIVTEQASTYLLLEADDDAYIPPDSNTKGYRKLRAFSRRPKDLHIEYWREIIDENFDALFPQKQKNPFLALCEYLEIPVTEKLTEGYEKNPFAPLWAVIMRRWGFREEENIERFYGLEEFAGISPDCFSVLYWDVCDMLSASACTEEENRLYMLDHFVRWALTVTSEADLARRGLWALATRPWTEEIKEELSKVYCLTDYRLLFTEEQKLSPRVQSHLLGHNLQWFGNHWSAEHFQTMEELNRIEDLWEGRCWGKPGYEIESSLFANPENGEDEGKGDLTRTIRLLVAYEFMLRGNRLCSGDYSVPSMLGRDMKVLRRFEPTISYRPRNGQYEIEDGKERYREETEVETLPDTSRKTRLLAYVRLLHDRGYLSRSIVDKLNGKPLPRRTFVRDLSILRQAFPQRELAYKRETKRYMWINDGEDKENDSHRDD